MRGLLLAGLAAAGVATAAAGQEPGAITSPNSAWNIVATSPDRPLVAVFPRDLEGSRALTGTCRVDFTVRSDGEVDAQTVVAECPTDAMAQLAVAAVARWKYFPAGDRAAARPQTAELRLDPPD